MSDAVHVPITTPDAARASTGADGHPAARVPVWQIMVLVAVGVLTGVGLLFGEGQLGGLTSTVPMTAVGIATLCYLAAAVTGIRWMAWAWVGIGTALVFAAEVFDLPRWPVLAIIGAAFLVVGLARRPRITVPQAIAMAAYFGVAVVGLYLAPRLGLAVAGLALTAHAVWDFIHFRRNTVVNRSLALWCMGLDVFLGIVCIAFAISG